MPSIKPLRKLVSKARDLRQSHGERHRPSGFGFALADSVDYLDAVRWDALTAGDSLFLSRRYLRVLEDARPENLHPRYALIFRGRQAVAAVAAQSIKLSFTRTRKVSKHENLTKPLERLEERMLVCGNVLSWGMHGVAFAAGEDPLVVWPAVAEAIYRVRRAAKNGARSRVDHVRPAGSRTIEKRKGRRCRDAAKRRSQKQLFHCGLDSSELDAGKKGGILYGNFRRSLGNIGNIGIRRID